jgi:hypothetical protein
MKYVIIRDNSAGNESVGEMWQETKIFDENATLAEVMKWAEGHSAYGEGLDAGYSKKHIQITRPDQ